MTTVAEAQRDTSARNTDVQHLSSPDKVDDTAVEGNQQTMSKNQQKKLAKKERYNSTSRPRSTQG